MAGKMNGGQAWAEAYFFDAEALQDDPRQLAPTWTMPPFSQEKAVGNADQGPTLSEDKPYESAREYVRRHCTVDGLSGLYCWQGQWWRWNGQHYAVKTEENVRSDVYEFLNGASKVVKTDEGFTGVPFRPKPYQVNSVMDGLRSGLYFEAPAGLWLPEGQSAKDVLVFANGWVDLRSGKLEPPTHRLWVQGGLDYVFDEEAECPEWLKFLESTFPGDGASQECVEEILGYCMTEDIRFEKGFLLVGKPRSGKGTIAHVLRLLVGLGQFVSLSFHTWNRGENSRQKLIGKKVGVFADVRFKPGKWYGQTFDPGGIDHQSAELLLNLTGGDPVSVGRKWKEDWEGKSPIKIILISNEVPNLQDEAGVLPTRFIVIEFKVSFLGREDVELKRKLEGELPGIANRCLVAYRRLLARGRFVQPASGLELERKIKQKVNVYAKFLEERCVVEDGATAVIGLVRDRFQAWCWETGRLDVFRSTPKNELKGKLAGALGWDDIIVTKPHGRPRQYHGFRLKDLMERLDDD
jgi:putative DNA primase/helicase